MILKEHQVANPQRTDIELSEKVKAIDEQLKENPDQVDLLMKRGLALADMRLMREAVEWFSKAIAVDPFCGILYRHRAHRHLSCWEFDEACADFTIASRLIPDNWDVWYHLGLSYYLLGNYEKALKAYKLCYEMSEAEDKLIAVSDWYWMTLMRSGHKDTADAVLARITENMDPKENTAYYNRLLMYKGILKHEDLFSENDDDLQVITRYYGVSNYYYIMGDVAKSNQMIEKILQAGDKQWWSAFGYLAAMVDKRTRS